MKGQQPHARSRNTAVPFRLSATMKFTSLTFLAITPVLASCLAQLPLVYHDFPTGEHYQFKYPIRRVAIIGAGVG